MNQQHDKYNIKKFLVPTTGYGTTAILHVKYGADEWLSIQCNATCQEHLISATLHTVDCTVETRLL